MRMLVTILVLFSTLAAKTHSFTETRYSDAFDSSVELKGLIKFTENSLKINYDEDNREILYKDSSLIIKQNEEILEINEQQEQQVSSFFEILLLLYANDENLLEKHFIVKPMEKVILLTPRGDLSQYIEKISLQKHKKLLNKVKLFLKNSDYISISIENEIR